MRKVHVTVEVEVTLNVDEGVLIEDVMDHLFVGLQGRGEIGADLEDSSIGNWEITDSR
jgi:hypothetical protein